jgi:hypothetical protein
MAEFASKGVAGTALGLGAGALGVELLNGGIGKLLGNLTGGNNGCNNGCNDAAAIMAAVAPMLAAATVTRPDCGGHSYGRYDAEKDAEIAALKGDIKLRDSTIYTDQKSLALYQYIDGQLKEVREELCQQRVHNQRTEDSFALARQDLAAVKADLDGKIKLEAERRCCADNAIVRYANATFYPKMVADVTVGTTTTAQMLYNPLPDCGGCCDK